MADALIFDIDGTLLDSVDLHATAWRETFLHFGYEFPFERIRSQIGKGGDQLLPEFLSPEEIEEKGKAMQEFRSALFKDKFLSQVKPFPQVRELFQHALKQGQKVALASSAQGDELQTYEKIAQIEDLVQAETSSADAEKSKPHPDIFEAALERLQGIDASQAIVIGDTTHDVVAAKRANLRSVGVVCGGTSEEELLKAGAIAVYRDPADLLAHYEDSPLAK